MTVRIDLLGPLRLSVDGEPTEVPGTKRRAVLALLALSEGRSITVDELLGSIWPSEVPDSGRRALHSHVSRVRGHLGRAADRLVREGDSYRLVLLPGELDVVEARQLAGQSEQVAAGEAVGLLRDALGQWRGTALDEFADVAPLAAAAVGLDELRRELQDQLLEVRLAAGPDAALVHDAARAAAADPLRERTQLALARVLAADGRSAEALRVVHDLRRRLADETGLDPSPAVAALETEVATGMLAPRATADRPTGRARPPSPLVGRQRELAELTHLVAGERLVTLVGPGGVGKTRLTLEVVADLLDEGTREVAFVELAAVDDGTRLPDAVGAALGLRTPDRHDLLTVAIECLAIGAPVLVLDNCEHLLDDCRDLAARLVGTCDGLTVVATSREPLGLAGERVVRLGPLAVPPPGARPEEVAAAPAIVAFRLHAERRDGTFVLSDADLPIVAEIARRLDGLPLALELAAGRTTSLSVGDLRDRLGRALDLLEAGRASTELRHRTLRSTIEWSYRLLAAPEQRLLRALAQLPSGFGLDAAEHVGTTLAIEGDPAGHLARLVDASVVAREQSPVGSRYLLLETVRAFALDELTAHGEQQAAARAVVSYGVSLAGRLGRELCGPGEAAADARLRRELPNLRAAFRTALAQGVWKAAVDIVVDLDEAALWRVMPDLHDWAMELATRPDVSELPRAAEVLGTAARAAWQRGELDAAQRLVDHALRLATNDVEATRAIDVIGTLALFGGDLGLARESYLAAAAGRPDYASLPTSAALAAIYAGERQEAERLLERAEELAREGHSLTDRAYYLYARGELEAQHDPVAALQAYGEAIELARESGAGFVEGIASVGLVRLWTSTGQIDQALHGFRWLLEHWRRGGSWIQQWTTLRNLAYLLIEVGDHGTAALLLAAADEAAESSAVAGDPVLEQAWVTLAGRLGDDGLAGARREAEGLGRVAVVDAALAAIDRLSA